MMRIISTGRAARPAMQVRWYGKRHKIYSVADAVALVQSNDTVAVSGFVCQGTPEALLRGLGERFDKHGNVRDLTCLFGGGPGDFASRGLNHLAKEGLVKTAIGGHYGQVPALAKLALENKIEAYCVPMGSVSRMLRASASGVPGHLTKVGLNTFVDPRHGGGALNDKSTDPVVHVVDILGEEYLLYKAVPVNVAIIRATTGDSEGNLTFERESLLTDARVIAMAARSSGGVVLAQVERIAAPCSLPMRSVHIPGALVDCVVLGEKKEDSHQSFFTEYNPSWSGEIREPLDMPHRWPLDARKIIARRGALELELDQIINLGIGMPEGIASIAREENIFQNVTLTTEGGVFGGVGASGHEFGPATCASSLQEINQQFDFYNGGGLDICFLGLAECGQNGDVNVSRLTETSLTGPGGFIDITQCTRKVVFMGTFRKRGFQLQMKEAHDGSRALEIVQEGAFPAFKPKVREVTFSHKVALERGQEVLYVTERAVFKLTYRGLKLIEVAPGVDIDRDVVSQMEFEPVVNRDQVREMDQRIFREEKMGLVDDLFSAEKAIADRFDFHKDTRTAYLDLSGFYVTSEAHLLEHFSTFDSILSEITNRGAEKIQMVANYDGFDIRDELAPVWMEMAKSMEEKYYSNVTRHMGRAFRRKKLGDDIGMLSLDDMWNVFQEGHGWRRERLDRRRLTGALWKVYHVRVTPEVIDSLMLGKEVLERDEFQDLIDRIEHYVKKGKVVLNERQEAQFEVRKKERREQS